MEPSASATALKNYLENKENFQDSELPSTSAPGPSSWSHYVHYYSNSDTKTTSNQPSNHSYNNYDPSKFQAYHQHQRQLLHAKNLFRNEPDEPGYQPVVNYGVPPPPKPPAPNTRDDLSPLCSPCGSPPRMYDFDDEPEDELPPSPPKVQETTENVELSPDKKDKLSPPPMPPDFPFTFPDLRPPPIPPLFPFSTPHLLPPLLNIDNGNQNQNKLEPYLRKRLQRELDQLLKAKSTTKLEPWMLFVIDPDLPQPLVDMCKPFLCKLCGLGLSSRIVSIDHYKGKRHRLKINEWLRVNRHPLARLFEESSPQSYRSPVPQTQMKPQPLFQIKVPTPNKSAIAARNSTNKKKNKSKIKSKKKISNLGKKVVKPIKQQSASTSKSTPALSAADVKKNLEYKNALLRQLLESKIPLPRLLRIQCGTWHCKLCDVRHFSLSHSADHYLSYRHRLSALRWLEENSCVPTLLENNARYESEKAAPQQQQPPHQPRQYQQQRIPSTKPRTYWNYIKKKKIGFFGHHHQNISNNSNNNFRTLGENARRALQTLNPRPIQQSDLNSSNCNSSELNRRLTPQILHPLIERSEFSPSINATSPGQNRRLAPQTLYPYLVQQRPFNSNNNSSSSDQNNLLVLTPVNLISHPLHIQQLQQRSLSPGYSGQRYEELPPQNVIARTHTPPPPQQRNFISNQSSSFHPNLDSQNPISHPVVKIARNRPELEARFPIFRDPGHPGPR